MANTHNPDKLPPGDTPEPPGAFAEIVEMLGRQRADGLHDGAQVYVSRCGQPQMRLAGLNEGEMKPQPSVIHRFEHKPHGVGLHFLGGRLGFVIAMALLAAFALGYLAGTL